MRRLGRRDGGWIVPRREDGVGTSGLEYGICLYFGTRYGPEPIERTLGTLSGWISDSPVSAQFERIAVDEVTFEKIAGTKLGRRDPESLPLGSRSLHDRLGRDYLSALRTHLRRGGRPVRLSPFIDLENGLTLKVDVGLREGEEELRHPELLARLGGEDSLLRAIDGIDPLWAVMDVEAGPLTMEDLGSEGGHLPDSGYWGARTVSALGGTEVQRLIARCPKAVYLPAGGLFLDWRWKGGSMGTNEEYRAFLAACASASQRVYHALRPRLADS